MKTKHLQEVLALVDVLHEVANPDSDTDPVAARAIWEAVRNALDARGLNYPNIVSSRSILEIYLREGDLGGA